MKRLSLILTTILLLLSCIACKDKDVYSDSSDVSSKDNNSSVVTESQNGSVTDNSKVQGGTNSTASGTVSTVVDEIILNEPTSSVITAIDLETGKEVQVTISSKPSSTTQGSSSTVVGSSSTVVNSSSSPTVSSSAPQGSGDNNQGDEETQPPEQSSSSQKPKDQDTMDGFLPWK